MRTTSLALENVLSGLGTCSQQHSDQRSEQNDNLDEQDVSHLGSRFASQLWKQLQKHLSIKSTTPLQAFVASDTLAACSGSHSQLILFEQQEPGEHVPVQSTDMGSMSVDKSPKSSDELKLHRSPRSSAGAKVSTQRERPSEILSRHDPLYSAGECGDDLLLETLPHHIPPKVASGCQAEFRSVSYSTDTPASKDETLVQGASTANSHYILGRSQTAEEHEFASSFCISPTPAETKPLQNEQMLLEEYEL